MFSMLPSFVLWSQLPEKPLEDSQETGRLTKLFVLQNRTRNITQTNEHLGQRNSLSLFQCQCFTVQSIEGKGKGMVASRVINMVSWVHLKNHHPPHFVTRESLFSRRGQCWLCRRKTLTNRWNVILAWCYLFMSDVKFSCTFKNIQSKVYKDMGPHDSNLIPLRKLSLLSNLGSWQRNNRRRWKSIVIIIIIMDENLGS